jgi:hypothetical protein
VGSPLPYRIDLPRDWEINRGSETGNYGEAYTLTAGNGSLMVFLTVADLVETDDAVKRQTTDRNLRSDSFLRDAMRQTSASWRKSGGVSELVQEIRTLGGQRAMYIRCRIVQDGKPHWLEMYGTVQDGIAYKLVTRAEGDDYAAHEPLFARIRQSLVLGGGGASAGFREAR